MKKVRFGIIGYGVQGKFYSAILTGGELPGIGRIPQPEGCVLSAISVRRKEIRAEVSPSFRAVKKPEAKMAKPANRKDKAKIWKASMVISVNSRS